LSEDIFRAPAPAPLGGHVRAVFFDAGNTLTYLDLAWIAARLREDGWDMDEESLFYGQCVASYEASRMALLMKYPTDSDRQVPYFSRVLELAGIPKDFTEDCAMILAEEHKRSILWRNVPPFVHATLDELKNRGYILGVVSNTDGRLKALLDRTRLTRFFKCIIDSSVVGVEKPHPAIFERAVEAVETEPSSCIYVGDIYAVDIEGARRAGLGGVLLDPMRLHNEFDCVKITKLPDLLDLLPPVANRTGDGTT